MCDVIITDAGSGKKTLVGVFDKFLPPQVPCQIGGFWLFARVTDAEGKYAFKVKFVSLKKDTTVAELITNEVESKDRLGFLDLVITLPALPVPELGRYEFQLYANEVYIGRITVSVELAPGGS